MQLKLIPVILLIYSCESLAYKPLYASETDPVPQELLDDYLSIDSASNPCSVMATSDRRYIILVGNKNAPYLCYPELKNTTPPAAVRSETTPGAPVDSNTDTISEPSVWVGDLDSGKLMAQKYKYPSGKITTPASGASVTQPSLPESTTNEKIESYFESSYIDSPKNIIYVCRVDLHTIPEDKVAENTIGQLSSNSLESKAKTPKRIIIKSEVYINVLVFKPEDGSVSAYPFTTTGQSSSLLYSRQDVSSANNEATGKGVLVYSGLEYEHPYCSGLVIKHSKASATGQLTNLSMSSTEEDAPTTTTAATIDDDTYAYVAVANYLSCDNDTHRYILDGRSALIRVKIPKTLEADPATPVAPVGAGLTKSMRLLRPGVLINSELQDDQPTSTEEDALKPKTLLIFEDPYHYDSKYYVGISSLFSYSPYTAPASTPVVSNSTLLNRLLESSEQNQTSNTNNYKLYMVIDARKQILQIDMKNDTKITSSTAAQTIDKISKIMVDGIASSQPETVPPTTTYPLDTPSVELGDNCYPYSVAAAAPGATDATGDTLYLSIRCIPNETPPVQETSFLESILGNARATVSDVSDDKKLKSSGVYKLTKAASAQSLLSSASAPSADGATNTTPYIKYTSKQIRWYQQPGPINIIAGASNKNYLMVLETEKDKYTKYLKTYITTELK